MTSLIGQSLGRYHILEQLGEGGMAVVYKAYDTLLERNVAIKIIRKGAFPAEQLERILKRFEREAKALARLSHPNIVKVHDFGEYEGSPYLVMEYLPGGTLKGKMSQPISWQEAAHLLIPVAHALANAHQQGILHRDVKPSNIMITGTGDPMLTDFGIAKILDIEETHTLTGSGVGIGTPEYMAPEQGLGKEIDARADVYSLGIIFYELVTGRKPYTADTPMAVVIKQINDPLPPPRQFVPSLPEKVERVLLKALAKNPENRFPDMGAFAAALESLPDAATQPVGILPTTEKTLDALGPPTRRIDSPFLPTPKKKTLWPWAAGVGGLIVVACVVITALMLPKLVAMLAPAPTGTPAPTQTFSSTSAPTAVLPATSVASATASLEIGSTWTRPSDGMVMVYVPEGAFSMGDTTDQALAECSKFFNDCQQNDYIDEQPPHSISLDAYWIDRTEVTNAMYAKCMQAGICQRPGKSISQTRTNYFSNSQYTEYPVIYVDWNAAQTYCNWAGGHLPSEAEWEKAARGMDGRTYPWGNSLPTCSLANFGDPMNCKGDTSPVESYPSGVSLYGNLNMSGNVSEWVNDWYSDTSYSPLPQSNPTGPDTGQERVFRGGSWFLNTNYIRSTNRDHASPTYLRNDIGFRCARTANP